MDPGNERLYLDHAATSWPKPPAVTAAVVRWLTELGVSAERGDSGHAAEVRATVQGLRRRLGAMTGVPPEHVAFTSGATEGLNLLLRGLLSAGDRVVTTAIEHSSVVRPLTALVDALDIDVAVAPCDGTGFVDPAAVAALVRARRTRLVVIAHASNVTGAIQPIAAIRDVAHAHDALLLLDASQTIGAIGTDIGADLLAASAHKALLGPPGLGFVAVRDPARLRIVKQGGSGGSMALDRAPTEWPTAFEAGTPNTPALFGLAAALEDPAVIAPDAARRRQLAIVDELRELLHDAGHRVLHPAGDAPRLPILSCAPRDHDPAEIGLLLDAHAIDVRSGYHCAPWIHDHLGTRAQGTVRFSPGPFVSADAPQRVATALGLAGSDTPRSRS